MAAVCPVIGTTTNVLPPHHPAFSPDDPTARCPITNATATHHPTDTIHFHPSTPSLPNTTSTSTTSMSSSSSTTNPIVMDACQCPALQRASASASASDANSNTNVQTPFTDATCPVVGPVSAHLPPTHPALQTEQVDAKCPVTNASLGNHVGKVREHVPVVEGADVGKCPVMGRGRE